MNSGDPAGGTGGNLGAQDGTSPSGRNQSVWLPYFGYRSTFIVNFGQNGTFNGTKTAQGNADENGIGDFYYSVPSGFVALTASHLPDQTISEDGSSQAEDHFDTILFNGTGADQTVSGFNFQPDFVWNKTRNEARHHTLNDSVRGGGHLKSSNTDQQGQSTISAYNSDGYDWTYNSANNWYTSSGTVASWCLESWRQRIK